MNFGLKIALQTVVYSVVGYVGVGYLFDLYGHHTITTVETAAKALGGHSYIWKDETGVKYGIPTQIYVLSFSKDFTKCGVQSRPVTEDKFGTEQIGDVTAQTDRYIDTGAQYVSFHCSVDGFKYTIDRSDKIMIHSAESNVPFTEATRK